MFVVAIIAAALGLAAVIIAGFLKFTDYRINPNTREKEEVEVTGPKRTVRIAGVGLFALGLVLAGFSSFYSLDVGQASVLKDWTGNIVGTDTTQGVHAKSPWSTVIKYDVRNQRIVYAGAAGNQSDNSGGTADGSQITVQDQSGVTDNIDIAIRYSINPGAVTDIYRQYQTEANLQTKLIFNDVRSVVRSVPGKYTTLELLTKRNDVQKDIQKALEAKWADDGIIVDDVALQEIRIPDSVRNSYAAAQEAQINVSKEQAKLDAAKVSAQQKVVKAEAQAKANDLLTASLSPQVLQNKYLDALKAGTVYVVPEGSTPYIGAK